MPQFIGYGYRGWQILPFPVGCARIGNGRKKHSSCCASSISMGSGADGALTPAGNGWGIESLGFNSFWTIRCYAKQNLGKCPGF